MKDDYNKFYEVGYIYIMECYGVLPYYGSTNQTLEDRLDNHYKHYKCWKNGKHRYCSSFELIETGMPISINLVEKHKDIYRRDLEKIEGVYQRNNPCVNMKIPSGLTRKEYHKQYNKQYREKNKDEINKKKNQKFSCSCGGRFTHSHKARHFRTKKHKDWEKKNKKIIVIKKI